MGESDREEDGEECERGEDTLEYSDVKDKSEKKKMESENPLFGSLSSNKNKTNVYILCDIMCRKSLFHGLFIVYRRGKGEKRGYMCVCVCVYVIVCINISILRENIFSPSKNSLVVYMGYNSTYVYNILYIIVMWIS